MEILPRHSCEPPRLLAELSDLPPKPPRSKLEPHRELIRELRRKGRTYREVSRLFAERLGLQVAPSTLHSFVKVRARHRKQVQFELPAVEPPSSQPPVSARLPDGFLGACKWVLWARRSGGQYSSSTDFNPSDPTHRPR
jgi:hypothetical protein